MTNALKHRHIKFKCCIMFLHTCFIISHFTLYAPCVFQCFLPLEKFIKCYKNNIWNKIRKNKDKYLLVTVSSCYFNTFKFWLYQILLTLHVGSHDFWTGIRVCWIMNLNPKAWHILLLSYSCSLLKLSFFSFLFTFQTLPTK